MSVPVTSIDAHSGRPWTVGDKVIIVHTSRPDQQATIVKVARKWITADGDAWGSWQFDFDGNGKPDGDFGSRFKAYTPERHAFEQHRHKVVLRLRELTRYGDWVRRLSSDSIERIIKIIETDL